MEENKQSISETEDISKAYETYFNRKMGDKLNTIFTKNNLVAIVLKCLGIFVIGFSIVIWCLISIATDKIDWLLFLDYLGIGFLISLSFFAVAEFIQIFHDIRFRLWMK